MVGGHEDDALLALGDAFEGGAQGDLGLAEAHVAAQEPIHRDGALHVPLDFIDAAELILRFLVFKPAFKIILPFAVRAESEAGGRHPFAVEDGQLPGDVLDRAAHPCFGFLPFLAAEAVEPDLYVVLCADVFAYQVKLGDRDIEGVSLVVLELKVVLDDPLYLKLVHPLVDADAMRRMYDVIAGGEFGQAVDFGAFVPFGPAGFPPDRGKPRRG